MYWSYFTVQLWILLLIIINNLLMRSIRAKTVECSLNYLLTQLFGFKKKNFLSHTENFRYKYSSIKLNFVHYIKIITCGNEFNRDELHVWSHRIKPVYEQHPNSYPLSRLITFDSDYEHRAVLRMKEDFSHMLHDTEFCDAEISVEVHGSLNREIFLVHKAILAARSPAFRRMLRSQLFPKPRPSFTDTA